MMDGSDCKNKSCGALYIRVSTEKQEELSPDAQKRLGLEWAEKNHITIKPEHIFMENGISGRAAKNRPQFQKMIALAKTNPPPFRYILVWKFSRFARNQEESILYKSLLRKQCRIDVVSISEPLMDGPFGELIERIIEWTDEYYSINLSGEVSRGMTENALRGGYQSTPPLGYLAVGGSAPYVICEEEYRIVTYIFHAACYDHICPTEIARNLNDMGYRTRRQTPFEARNITYILKNQFYIGKLIWNGIEQEGRHEVRITKEIFDECQSFLESIQRQGKRNGKNSRHWLSGLVKCSQCGASLAYNSQGAHGSPYFNCWRYGKGLHRGSNAISVKKCENAVLEFFQKLSEGRDYSFTYRSPRNTVLSPGENYEKELERIESRKQRIRLAYENGIDTLEEYKENKLRLEADRKHISDLLAKHNSPADLSVKETAAEKVKTVTQLLQGKDVDDNMKKRFVRSVLEEIIFDRETETFIFRLSSP